MLCLAWHRDDWLVRVPLGNRIPVVERAQDADYRASFQFPNGSTIAIVFAEPITNLYRPQGEENSVARKPRDKRKAKAESEGLFMQQSIHAPVKHRKAKKETAETMAAKQKEISVSEFFARNRHLIGFDKPRKALLTTVKEAVDKSLDACEEAQILPNVTVVIEDLQPDRPANAKQSRYRVTVVDNGPGIVRKQVENVFGRLLFGSKFHRLKMSRGQQGIGISAAGMYGLITTGKPMVIHTRPHPRKAAHHIELAMNTKTNRAQVTIDDETEDFPPRS